MTAAAAELEVLEPVRPAGREGDAVMHLEAIRPAAADADAITIPHLVA